MKKEKKIIQPNLDTVPGGALKRTGAVLIDVVIMYLLMNVIWFAIHPIYNKVYDIDNVVAAHERDKKRSNLVVLSEPLLADESNIENVKVTNNQLSETKRGEGVFKFYTVFLRGEQEAKLAAGEIDNTPENNHMFTLEWYLEMVIKPDTEESIYLRIPTDEHLGAEGAVSSEETAEPEYDTFRPAGLDFKEGLTAADINKFNTQIYNQAVNAFNLRPNMTIINKVNLQENIILMVLGSTVVFLVFPLFFKNGQTLGKKALKLGVTTRQGYKITVPWLLLRYFAFLFINLLSNLLLPFVLPFISITIMTFSKERRSAHDFIANTKVIDLPNSKVYETEAEFLEAQKRTNPRLDAEEFNEEVFSERFDEESGA
ncbi:MAG: RDD family protein [Tenericutes bacterium ADurb.Bin087]|nr:MAG: RDD family protein [Tenericutes bacterium ADurb.Bin087]